MVCFAGFRFVENHLRQIRLARSPAATIGTEKTGRKNGYLPYWDMAKIYAELGEKDAAFFYLEKCRQNRQLYMLWLRIEPKLDTLRSDPRFEDLIRRVGLK